MIVVAKELLQYEKKYVNYYLNIPKLCYKEKNIVKNEMIEDINSLIFEDIITFMNMMEDSYNNSISKEYTLINSLTEFQVGYLSKDIISMAIEFSQLVGFSDISYIKVYNYDFKFNLSKGSRAFIVTDEEIKKELIKVVNKIVNNIDCNFVSVDIVKTVDNKYKVLEINSGVSIEKVVNFIDNGYAIAKEIYKDAINSMF